MPFPIAQTANLSLTSRTFPKLLPAFGMYIGRSYPFSAFPRRTVYSILGRVLLKLPVPEYLELRVKELVNVFQGYMSARAAFRGHMLRIVHRHSKYSSQAGMAHSMAAFQLRGFPVRYLVHTSQALNPVVVSIVTRRRVQLLLTFE